ncbi:OmpW family protein [Massilia sp. AB1]|uniref:OmpW/AlkL family protein n=1 Tax=Massilia sp. AB1 TaxID=2823371 RepID=UPI001B83CD73|nr:OmpW family outer membrane protein [Massilia sp. AB1]MBQ5938830.1 OmpW family protein [Massilia sp. AB1]
MRTMTNTLLATLIAVAASQAMAQEAPWLLRARAVHIDPAGKSSPLGGNGAADRIGVGSKTIPEVDISYFFTPRLAAELVLTYPQKHGVYLDGARIGSFRHLPPTLSLQYHFLPAAGFQPYVGLGVNYTRISKVKLLDGAAGLEKDSWGAAVQAGIDYRLNQRWSLNLDVKKVTIRSDVFVGGATASRVKVDPVLFGIGAGYRF